MYKYLSAFFFLLIPTVSSAYAEDNSHAFSSFDKEDVLWVKQHLSDHDDRLKPAFSELLRAADSDLSKAPKSVMDKGGMADSKDRHDFYSMSKYSWNNRGDSKKRDDAYVYRDGFRNPEASDSQYDKKNFNDTVRSINRLALAYYFTGNKAYAEKAADLLRVWFIDPKTRMNPNFRYAAMRPGINRGSYTGIVEGVVLIEMLDYVALLDGSDAMSEEDVQELRSWFTSLSGWLLESDFGKQAGASKGNQSSWYYAQIIAYSLYGGDAARARAILKIAKDNFKIQIASNGSLPTEMGRANSATYSVYGLRSIITLARLSTYLGDSFWSVGSSSKPIIKQALYFLYPYYSGQAQWKFGTVHAEVDPYAIQIFRLGARAYNTSDFDGAISYLQKKGPNTDRYVWLLGPSL